MRAAAFVLVLLMSGCASIQAPTVMPFADSSHWMLVRSLEYRLKDSDYVVSVPEGFVTDFASVPRIAWMFMSPYDRHGRAAIVHDWLYWSQGCTREQADKIMLLGMIETKVSTVGRLSIYSALRIAGESAWKDNRDDKRRGLPRVVPKSVLPIPDDAVWPDFRSAIASQGIRPEPDETPSTPPAYCNAVEALLRGDVVSQQAAQGPTSPSSAGPRP